MRFFAQSLALDSSANDLGFAHANRLRKLFESTLLTLFNINLFAYHLRHNRLQHWDIYCIIHNVEREGEGELGLETALGLQSRHR